MTDEPTIETTESEDVNPDAAPEEAGDAATDVDGEPDEEAEHMLPQSVFRQGGG